MNVRAGAEVAVAPGPLSVEAEAPLPTEHGTFRVLVFRHAASPGKEHLALVMGDVAGEDVPVRVHSECLTGEALGSLKCDCGDQLRTALGRIGRSGRGILLYLRQEGRDIGLANKIRAYALQAAGADTVDANRRLGLPDDARSYEAAADMLRFLEVRSVKLLTNNPAKVEALVALGIPVTTRVPVISPSNPHSAGYLATKRARMGHALPAPLPLLSKSPLVGGAAAPLVAPRRASARLRTLRRPRS